MSSLTVMSSTLYVVAATSERQISRATPFQVVGSATVAMLGIVLALFLYGAWFSVAAGDPDAIDKDWIAFDSAAEHVVSGDLAAAYTETVDELWPYLYPPYALPLAAPLAALGSWHSYLFVAGLPLVLTAVAVGALLRAGRARRYQIAGTIGLMAVAGPVMSTVVTGQYSAIYLLGVALWATNWMQGRHTRAGLWLSLVLLKPNLVLPIMALALWRERRQWKGMAAGFAGACVVSLAVGPTVWRAFFATLAETARRHSGEAIPVEKEATVLSTIRVLSGDGSLSTVAIGCWFLAAAVTGVTLLLLWRRTIAPGALLRLAGTAVLFAVAANPRLYFYDALVLVVPAMAWYLGRDTYSRVAYRRLVGVVILASCVANWGLSLPGANTIWVGPLAALWLALEIRDLWAGGSAGGQAAQVAGTDEAGGQLGQVDLPAVAVAA